MGVVWFMQPPGSGYISETLYQTNCEVKSSRKRVTYLIELPVLYKIIMCYNSDKNVLLICTHLWVHVLWLPGVYVYTPALYIELHYT